MKHQRLLGRGMMDDGHDQSQQQSQMLASLVNKEDHMTHWYRNFFFFNSQPPEIFGVLYPNLRDWYTLTHIRLHLKFLVSYTQISPIATSSSKLYTYPNLRDWYTLAHICLRLKFLVSYTQISTIATSSYTLSIFHLGSSVASSCLLVVSFIIIEANHFTAGLPSVPLSRLRLWSLVSYTQISVIMTRLNHCAASHSPL